VTGSRRYTLLQKVAALAPIALLLVFLPGQAYLRCRIDGTVRATCCCGQAMAPANPGPIARAQDCCDRETTTTVRPVVEAPGGRFVDHVPAGPAVASVMLPVPSLPAPRWDRAQPSHGPPRGGPPVILLKQAFLI